MDADDAKGISRWTRNTLEYPLLYVVRLRLDSDIRGQNKSSVALARKT